MLHAVTLKEMSALIYHIFLTWLAPFQINSCLHYEHTDTFVSTDSIHHIKCTTNNFKHIQLNMIWSDLWVLSEALLYDFAL